MPQTLPPRRPSPIRQGASRHLVFALGVAACLAAPSAFAKEALRAKVTQAAQAHGVPAALALAMVQLESGFRPQAANAGNYGLMQIRLQTARSLGYGGSATGLLDAATNLKYGMLYLARAHKAAGGDLCGTIMRYQSGLRATRPSAANKAYCGRARTIIASN